MDVYTALRNTKQLLHNIWKMNEADKK